MSAARWGSATLVVVLAGGAYLTLDAHDLVPGIVTLAPVPDPAAPFPTAPGAAVGTAVLPVLGASDAAAPVPDPAALQPVVDALVADTRLGPSVGVLVTDCSTRAVLAQSLPDQPRVPASTAKLLTAVATLATVDPQTTLPTRVVRVAADRLVLVAGGDMMLSAGAGDPAVINGRAGLADLADQVVEVLHQAGITEVALGLDDTVFTGPLLSPTWDIANVNGGFVAPVAALGVDVARTDPAEEYSTRYSDPALQAARTFAALLAERGVVVPSGPVRTSAPADAVELGRVESAPVGDLVRYVMSTSDNTITEVLARLVAIRSGLPATFDGGRQAVLRAVAGLGIDVTGATLADASGLGEGSALSPRLLMDVLDLVARRPELADVGRGAPVGGLTGSLHDRFTTLPAAGVVRAKTGSLPGVTSLAGSVLTEDGRWLDFVVMADQTGQVGQWNARAAVDGFVQRLAACGCSG